MASLALSCGERPKAAAPVPPPAKGELIVTVFQLPVHGLAICLRTPGGRTFLIDTGGKSSTYNSGRDTVGPYLETRGIRRIEAILLSHPDHDHISGAKYILEHFSVGQLIDGGPDEADLPSRYPRLRTLVRERGAEYVAVGAGSVLSWDPTLAVEVLAPPPGGVPGEDSSAKSPHNDNSLVVRVQHGANVFLFPGDIQRRGRESLLLTSKPGRLKSTILVAPHHGFSHGRRFAEAARPEVVIVSCLPSYPDKSIASPGDEARAFYGGVGAKVLVTAAEGTVEVISDGVGYSLRTNPVSGRR